MTDNFLTKLLEHHNWANRQIIQACAALSDEQLDAEPLTATKGNIRLTLWHVVNSEQNYLSQLTGKAPRFNWQAPPAIAELQEAANVAGEGLLSLFGGDSRQHLISPIISQDGYSIEPWVLLVQVINHATEHREQIKSMLSVLGLAPPRIDGWAYGRVTGALIPPAT